MIIVKQQAIQKEKVEPFFEQWEELSRRIYNAHENRNGEAHQLMEQGIALFEQLVIHCSDVENVPAVLNEQYEVLPLNGLERYIFIKSRPGQYACYRQLEELFKEIKKRLARLRLK